MLSGVNSRIPICFGDYVRYLRGVLLVAGVLMTSTCTTQENLATPADKSIVSTDLNSLHVEQFFDGYIRGLYGLDFLSENLSFEKHENYWIVKGVLSPMMRAEAPRNAAALLREDNLKLFVEEFSEYTIGKPWETWKADISKK